MGGGDLVWPKKWFSRGNDLMGEGLAVRLSGDHDRCAEVDEASKVVFKVEELRQNILSLTREGGWDSVSRCSSYSLGYVLSAFRSASEKLSASAGICRRDETIEEVPLRNPDRAWARGMTFYTAPQVIHIDDLSGNRSKRFNPHMAVSISFTWNVYPWWRPSRLIVVWHYRSTCTRRAYHPRKRASSRTCTLYQQAPMSVPRS